MFGFNEFINQEFAWDSKTGDVRKNEKTIKIIDEEGHHCQRFTASSSKKFAWDSWTADEGERQKTSNIKEWVMQDNGIHLHEYHNTLYLQQ